MMPEQVSQVISIAEAAGTAILEVYRSGELGITQKDDESPLTLADQRADQIIVQGLQALTPSIPILTEESAQEEYGVRKGWETFWLVDPLDGTKEFIKRTGQFTVNIALITRGKPVLGVVYAPAIKLLYRAEQGEGAYRRDQNGERAVTSRQANRDDLSIVASRDHAGPQVESLKESFPGCGLKSMGSSLKLCLVAEGEADLYLRDGPTMEWDTGAAQAIVEEAGGSVTEWLGTTGGDPLRYNKEVLRNPPFLVKGDQGLEVKLPA